MGSKIIHPMRASQRRLTMEGLEPRTLMATDLDDSLSESFFLGQVSTTPMVVVDNISPDTDVDMFAFSIVAGQVVDFDIDTPLNGPEGLGTYVRLFSSQGIQLASNNDGAAPGENTVAFDSYLRFTFAADGTYYLGVSNFNNAYYDAISGDGDTSGGLYATGSYQLSIQALPVDPDDSLVEATSVGTVSSTAYTINKEIETDIDVDIFQFNVSANQVIDFDIDTTLNGSGGLGSYLLLFNSQGTPIDFNDDAAAPGENSIGFDAYLRYTFAVAGTYYLGVSNYNNVAYNPNTGNGDNSGGLYSIGAYQLSIQAIEAPTVDPDDTVSEANVLGAASTNPLIANNNISPDVDVDMFRFTVTAGQVVDFDIDTTQNGMGGLGSYFRLFTSEGLQLASNDDGAAPGEDTIGFDAYLRYTFVTAGTYFLGVSNNINTSYNAITGDGDASGGLNTIGNYTLTVAGLPTDPDDSLSEATALGALSSTSVTTNAIIDPDIDVDMFSFIVSSGQIVDFDIDTSLNGLGGLGSYIRLFNSQGTQIAFNDDAPSPEESKLGYDAYLRYTFATAGTYYLGVSNFNNVGYDPSLGNGDNAGGRHSIGAYQLVVQAIVDAPTDMDDSISEATSLGTVTTTPKSLSSSIAPDTDVDMFSFVATAGQTVGFDIDTINNGPPGLGAYIRLFDSQGNQIGFNDDAIAPGEQFGFDSYLEYTFATAGTFYLGVSNYNNITYNAIDGNGDTAGGTFSIGAYELIVQTISVGIPTLAMVITPGKISELGGVGIGTVTRTNGDPSQSITISLSSSSTLDATVPSTVTIPANVVSVNFQVIGVHNTTIGTTVVSITATSPNYTGTSSTVTVTDRDKKWHNATNPKDVDDDKNISPLDVLGIINHLNFFGSGDVPVGTPPPYLDVDGDNQITPLDVLVVLNFINQSGGGEGEGTNASLNASEDNLVESRSISYELGSVDSYYAQYGQGAWSDWETNWKRTKAISSRI